MGDRLFPRFKWIWRMAWLRRGAAPTPLTAAAPSDSSPSDKEDGANGKGHEHAYDAQSEHAVACRGRVRALQLRLGQRHLAAGGLKVAVNAINGRALLGHEAREAAKERRDLAHGRLHVAYILRAAARKGLLRAELLLRHELEGARGARSITTAAPAAAAAAAAATAAAPVCCCGGGRQRWADSDGSGATTAAITSPRPCT